MSKPVPDGFLDASVNLFYAVELLFDDMTIRLWSGIGDKVIDGALYEGVGDLLEISPVNEDGDLSAKGVSISLAGLDPQIIAIALAENYQNRPARLLFGSLSDAGAVDYYTLFRGRMDVMSIEEDGESAKVTISAENALIDLDRPRVLRYTSEDHKKRFPNDKGFDFVADIQDKEISWGKI